jgi:aspartate-semialdehyde dehydrogenase
MAAQTFTVAVVGATGAVGTEMLNVLAEQRFPVGRIVALASHRSAGSEVTFDGESIKVEELTENSFAGVDLALFSAGAATSERFAPFAVKAGAIVVDNTSFFRMKPDVPLVVPEVNPEAIDQHHGIIANPNCSTIQCVVALQPLHALAGLRRVFYSTYQSAAGAGQRAMEELKDQTVALLNFRDPPVEKFPRRLAFDCIPQIDKFLDDGSTKEERKMVDESRKILGLPGLRVSATCVRVPVFVGHAVAIHAEFERPISVEAARAALESAPGVVCHSDPAKYPTAVDAAGNDPVHVGRIRRDDGLENGIAMWVVADNLRKGAATNAVQIAQALVARGRLGTQH